MKRYFVGIITTIMLIITLCSCSTESNNANNKMIKLTTSSTKTVQEIYVNIDNIIAIYPKDTTTNDGATKTTSRIYCTNTVVGSYCIEVNESPEDIMKLIDN